MERKKIILLTVSLIFFMSLIATDFSQAAIQEATHLELAEKYAPVLFFHPEEVFRPQPVDVLLNEARLRKNRNNWFDATILNVVSISDLIDVGDTDVFLDVWYGSSGASDYKNFSAHREYYRNNLSPEAGGLPVTVYARVIEDNVSQKIILQYWLFYYYNDWFNKHEGDWELVQVVLDENANPEWVVMSQHHGGTRRAWKNTQIEGQSHPKVYVALGSHANYFWGNENYPNGMDIGNSRVEIFDRTGSAGEIMPQVILMPEYLMEEELLIGGDWLDFAGKWGESAFQSDFEGPTGPTEKGLQWEAPYTWGISQPLDVEVWYQNRLKVLVEGEVTDVTILFSGDGTLSRDDFDTGDWYFISHTDLAKENGLLFEIQTDIFENSVIHFYWPYPDEERVSHYVFSDLPEEGETVYLEVEETGTPWLQLANGNMVDPTFVDDFDATWDGNDLVWFVGYLTTNQVLTGVLISLAAGILPSLVYIYLIYSFDRNEKEPKSLIAAAFLWGALPAVLVALVVNLFYQIPPNLVGPQAIEAVQVGFFSPLVEELLKGMIVLVIASRYRKEFNNMLDGIIYAAMVGLGFAMSGNIISYLASFLFRGFESLRMTILVEGLVFGLNHAFYTAIFGAGLGYAISLNGERKKLLSAGGAFFLAVVVNGVHGYVTGITVGLSPLTIILNWVGIGVLLVVMALSLRREDDVMRKELGDELPAKEYALIVSRDARRALAKIVKQKYGRKKYNKVMDQLHLYARLAFLKRQYRIDPSADLAQEIAGIREKLKSSDLIAEIIDGE